MPLLALARCVPEVELQGGACALAVHLRRAHDHRSKVCGHVGHAGVLPVDEADGSVRGHEEVGREEVIVGGDHLEAVGVGKRLQARDLLAQLAVSGYVDRPELAQNALVTVGLGDEIEGPLEDAPRAVERPIHLHRRAKLLLARHIQVANVGDEARDLPARLRVSGDEGVVNAQLGGQSQGGELGAAVHDLLGPNARMTVHVLRVAHREVARQVRDALFERIEVADIGLRAAERLHDVIEDLRVHVLHEQRVEAAKLVDGVKLVDDSVRVAANHHVEGLDVVEVDGLPELGRGLRPVVDALQHGAELSGERAVEVDVAEHDPRVRAADARARNPVGGTDLEAPLGRGTLHVVGRVIGLVHVGFERVRREVVVGGTHVGVVQDVSHQPQGAVVVAGGVLAIDDDVHPVLLSEVEEVLLLVAHNHRDVGDSGLVKLADLALHQDLPAHLERALGALVADGRETRGYAGGHDDGAGDPVGFEGLAASGGQGAVVNVAQGLALAGRRVDATQAHPGDLGEGALGEGALLLQERGQDVELRFGEGTDGAGCHGLPFVH